MTHKHTNSLINESSPYLLQHAHNPVNWYAWGSEALEKAKDENKIILVSIGYAACHWCHVMERESFENEAVADKMNRYFVNIKIDREERPDLDHIYMDAVQAMTGSGGWPLNVFLTPDAKPFYGGTYFPPVNAYNRPSWTEIITNLAQAWNERSNEIASQAENLLEHLKQSGNFDKLAAADGGFTKQQCGTIAENILKQADKVWGGFGHAPKFPQTFTIQYLLQYYHYTKNEQALSQALLSLDKMIDGGIYDHVGGGFARYSTDTEWLAPHFEKMLYDNALIINVLCDAYLITKNGRYESIIRQTIEFLKREMMHPDGGFYAALDADSEGEEGKFYVWSKEAIETLLAEDAALFCAFYDVTESGNWEGKNILRILKSADDFAAANNIKVDFLQNVLNTCTSRLLQERNKRIRPLTDDKILLGWNALLVTALCKAGAALADDSYIDLAVTTMDFLTTKFSTGSNHTELNHTYKNNQARHPAFLDDYAFLIQACIQMQEVTSDTGYLKKAMAFASFVNENFYDDASGFFLFTHKEQQDVVIRKKEVYDGATPSGNSVMAENLFYLSRVYDNAVMHQTAEALLLKLSTAVVRYPTSFAVWASLILKSTFGVHELVITGSDLSAFKKTLLQHYIPGKILQCSAQNETEYPLLKDKNVADKTLLYWCRQYECLPAFTSVKKFISEFEKWNYSTSAPQ